MKTILFAAMLAVPPLFAQAPPPAAIGGPGGFDPGTAPARNNNRGTIADPTVAADPKKDVARRMREIEISVLLRDYEQTLGELAAKNRARALLDAGTANDGETLSRKDELSREIETLTKWSKNLKEDLVKASREMSVVTTGRAPSVHSSVSTTTPMVTTAPEIPGLPGISVPPPPTGTGATAAPEALLPASPKKARNYPPDASPAIPGFPGAPATAPAPAIGGEAFPGAGAPPATTPPTTPGRRPSPGAGAPYAPGFAPSPAPAGIPGAGGPPPALPGAPAVPPTPPTPPTPGVAPAAGGFAPRQ